MEERSKDKFIKIFTDILSDVPDDILKECIETLKQQQSILVFYSKSADKKPGFGAGEVIVEGDNFSELSKIKDWRKILSNFHYDPFIWDGKEWSCIEEAFQAAKFGPENYDKFQAEIRKKSTNLSEDAGMVSRKMRKWKILNESQLKKWDLKKDKIMKDISIAKYNQSDIGKKVLLATKNAKLLHFLPRSKIKYIHFDHLEEIRSKLITVGHI